MPHYFPQVEGDVCDNAGGKCNDDFGTAITLTMEWQLFTIPFDRLGQVGFGEP